MNKFFEEIRKQSLAVRQVAFGLCVVATVSLVGMVWYNSFQTKLYTMMDRQPPTQDSTYLANSKNNNSPSLFASLSVTLGNMKAAALEIFHVFDKKSNNSDNSGSFTGKAYELPLSGDK